jgi:hypothetical protein
LFLNELRWIHSCSFLTSRVIRPTASGDAAPPVARGVHDAGIDAAADALRAEQSAPVRVPGSAAEPVAAHGHGRDVLVLRPGGGHRRVLGREPVGARRVRARVQCTVGGGHEVAIKKLRAGSGQGDREFRVEVEIISRVHHKNLVSLVGHCIHGEQRLLVYEYVPNKTLQFHLHGTKKTLDRHFSFISYQ